MNFCTRRPCFIDHLFLTFDFGQVPRRNFLQFFPFLVLRCFCCKNFRSLRHRNELVNQVVVLQWIFTFSCNMVFMVMRYRISHMHSRRFISFQNTRKFCFNYVGCTTPTISQNFTRHSRSHWCFQLLTSILDGLFEFLILRVDEIDPTQFSCVSQMEFFIRPLCLLLQLGILSIFSQSSGHRWSGLDVSCFLVNLPPDHIYPSGAFSSSRVNCVKPVQRCDKSRHPSIFQ